MEAEMAHGNLAFSSLRSSVMSAALASAFLVIANIAHAQAVNPTADHGSGGPGGFADLAEKVGPAVIGVAAKAAAADDESSGQRVVRSRHAKKGCSKVRNARSW